MICPKCGTENKADAKICSNCNEALKTNQNTVTSNPGGIRKAMKQDAKNHVKGSLVGATAAFLAVCAIIGMVLGGTTTNINDTSLDPKSFISSLLTTILGIIFSFGILIAGFKAIRKNEYSFQDVFTQPFNKLKFLGYILLLTLIVFVASFVLAFIPVLGIIALIALVIYFTPTITAFQLILADPNTKEDITFTDTWKKAMEISTNNRVEYWGITCSFIGWMLLSVLTLFILWIWLLPYMQLTYVNMYRRWVGEEQFQATETGLSNGAVCGITAGGCGCGCFVFIIFMSIVLAFIFTAAKDNPDVRSAIEKWAHENNINVTTDSNNQIDINKIIDDYNSNNQA